MNPRPTFRMLTGIALFAACGLAVISCTERDSNGIARISPEAARGKAVVKGTVKFLGAVPTMKVLKAEPCHNGAPGTILEETVIVDASQGLKNVFVYISGGPMVDGRSLPPNLLDQINCQYVPHVVGVVVGQPLKVKSSDPAFHNTHYTPRNNPSDNFGLLREGHEKEVRFTTAEIFPVRCDVHPWMAAHIGVFDNPFYAVTTDDGSFEIKHLPAGEYTLVAWHELYGELRQPLKVETAATVEAKFEYKPPQ